MNTRQPKLSANRTARRLIDWFAANARDLPWRRTLDPYAIWVSEIMLQQTQVATVIPYFNRWTKAAPNIATLARLSPTRLHKLWEGLGYYTRVRNLQQAARRILVEHHGRFPGDTDDILRLSGIGRYTAGAITSIAFNRPQPVVDGNVVRVLSRLLGIEGNPRDTTVLADFWAAAQELVEAAARIRSQPSPTNRQLLFSGNCSMLNQSLMELGATICTPRNPTCKECPVHRTCIARKQNRIEDLPQVAARAKPTSKRFVAFIIASRNRFYVRQRPGHVVNGFLWELPNEEIPPDAPNAVSEALSLLGIESASTEHLTTLSHTITRYRIRTECYRVRGDHNLPVSVARPMTRSEIAKLAFTSAHGRLIQLL